MTARALFHALIESLVYVAVDKLDFPTSMIFSAVMDLVVNVFMVQMYWLFISPLGKECPKNACAGKLGHYVGLSKG